jgi:hypothetical protein
MRVEPERLPRPDPGDAASTRDEWRLLVDRVCSSPQFRKAARMRELFQYLADRSISDPGAEVTEYEIAAVVFGRGEGFDPSESNIVRVGVRQLRSKLKEYFESEGAEERWVVEFPKGGYELRFVARADRPGNAKAGALADLMWRRWAAALGALSVVLAAALLWTASRPREAARSAPQAFLPRLVQSFEGPVQVVAADSAHVLIRHFGATPSDVEDYESGQYKRAIRPEELPPRIRDLWLALQTRQYLNMADVNIAYRLAAELHPDPPLLRLAKHMKTRDFRTGNFVVLGSGTSNPWHLLFRDQLNFHYEGEPGQLVRMRNRNPRPGEPEQFAPSRPLANESYGIAALVQNLTGTGKVLLIAGFSMEATEACGDFLLKPENRQRLLKALGVSSESSLAGFEVVLKTNAVSGTGRTAEIIATRATAAVG